MNLESTERSQTIQDLPNNPKVVIHSMIRRWDQYVPEAIDSVLAQTYENWELFIYSGEGSHDKITEYIQGNPKIHLIPGKNFVNTLEINKNERFTDTFLYVAAQGDLFTTLDGDDSFTANYLSDTVAYLIEHNLDVCSCSVDQVDSAGRVRGPQRKCLEDISFERKDFASNYNKIHYYFWTLWGRISRSSLFTAELFQDIPDYIDSYDTIISQNLLKVTQTFGTIQSVGYKYRVHGESDSYRFNPYREYVPSMIYRVMEESLLNIPDINKIDFKSWLFSQHTITIRFTIDSICGCKKEIEEKFNLAYFVCAQEEVILSFRPVKFQQTGIDVFSKLQRCLNQGGFQYEPENIDKLYEIANNLCPSYIKKIGKEEFENLIKAKMSFKVYCKKITI